MRRVDGLVGQSYQRVLFKDLPQTHQLAIVHYMALDGEAWEVLHDDSVENVKVAMVAAMPEYVKVYGDTPWKTATLPVERLKEAVMCDEEIADSFATWEAYAAWYLGAGDVPDHGNQDLWPVLLSTDDYETLLDGWHRLHSYVRSGCQAIPVVY